MPSEGVHTIALASGREALDRKPHLEYNSTV